MYQLRRRPPSQIFRLPPISTTSPYSKDSQQRQMLSPKATLPHFEASRPSSRRSKPHTLHQPSRTWAHIAAQSTNSQNQQPLSSVLVSIKPILTMFNFHKLCTQLPPLALKLQETSDPITRLVAVIDTVVGCLTPSP